MIYKGEIGISHQRKPHQSISGQNCKKGNAILVKALRYLNLSEPGGMVSQRKENLL